MLCNIEGENIGILCKTIHIHVLSV